MNGFGASRPQRRRTHPACPSRVFYGDRESAEDAAALLGSRVQACERCDGFHMALPVDVAGAGARGGAR